MLAQVRLAEQLGAGLGGQLLHCEGAQLLE